MQTLSSEQCQSKQGIDFNFILLGISVLIALIASQILPLGRLGPGFVIVAFLCVSCVAVFCHYSGRQFTVLDWIFSALGLLLCLALVFRHSPVLYWLNLGALSMVLMLAFARRIRGSLLDIPILSFLHVLPKFFELLTHAGFLGILKNCRLPDSGSERMKRFGSIGLGLLWSLPFLALFGALLVSADVRFESLALRLFTFDMEHIVSSVLKMILFVPFITAFVYGVTSGAGIAKLRTLESKPIEGAPLLTVLVSLNVLFYSYIVVQFSYFFGSDALLSSSDMTYASYAKRGFWEFIWISLILLPLLLFAHWLQKDDAQQVQAWFKRLATLLVAAVIIIEISAMHRMMMYVQTYGLTELRFYSSMFLLYMMAGLLLFAFKVLQQKRQQYVAIMSGLAVMLILSLNMVNPDARIVDYNLSRSDIRALDKPYISRLSADAIPGLYAARQSGPLDCQWLTALRLELQELPQWSQWNYAVSQAWTYLELWSQQCRSQ